MLCFAECLRNALLKCHADAAKMYVKFDGISAEEYIAMVVYKYAAAPYGICIGYRLWWQSPSHPTFCWTFQKRGNQIDIDPIWFPIADTNCTGSSVSIQQLEVL